MLALYTGFSSPATAAPLRFQPSGEDAPLLRAAEHALAARLSNATAGGKSSLAVALTPGRAAPGARPATTLKPDPDADLLAIPFRDLPANDPQFELADLAGLAADVPTARRLAQAYAERAAQRLHEPYRMRLLAVGTIEAQAVYCRQALKSLADLKGRRVRADGVWQARIIERIGGTPVPLAAGEVRNALAGRTIDCAIGGTLSGNQAGWHEAATSLFAMPIGWSMTHYVVTEHAWNTLDAAARAQLQGEFRQFEARLWDAAALYTREGYNCNAGIEPCSQGKRGRLSLVLPAEADRALVRAVVGEQVLPEWAARCGKDCLKAFDDGVGRLAGVRPASR